MPLLARVLGGLVLMGVVLVGGTATTAPAPPGAARDAARTVSAATTWAPVDRPGPRLTVPLAKRRGALHCTPRFDDRREDPVLLVSGTFTDPRNNYAWNYAPYFDSLGIPWCWVTVPDESTGDIQVAAEYIVHAIRRMHARSGDQISVLGHSQGGMSPRWALRFWPDTRAMVDDVIGMAPSNHGTDRGGPGPGDPQGGYAATFQQTAGSRFLQALNSRQETFRGIDYTVIVTANDEVVTPYRAGFLRRDGGRVTNVAVQQICPANTSEHLAVGTVDAVAAALVVDALDRPGPASPQAIPGPVCTQPFQPGVRAADAPRLLADLAPMVEQQATLLEGTFVQKEPPLRCYVFARGCRPRAGGSEPTSQQGGGASDEGASNADESEPANDTADGGTAAAAAPRVPTSFPAGLEPEEEGGISRGAVILGLLALAVTAGVLRTARVRRLSRRA